MLLDCFRCGVCCVKFQAPAGYEEINRISVFLGISPEQFISQYTDPRWPGKEKLLLHNGGGCCFLDNSSSPLIHNCRIHKVRPEACRDWNSGPEKSECREGLLRDWRLVVDSNGDLSGKESDIKAFEGFVRALRAQ